MTLFTVNPFDDGYYKNGEPSRDVEKICFRRWKKLFPNLKVFDYNSKEIQEAIKLFPNTYAACLEDSSEKCVFGDIARLYILSKYEDHIYFDNDLYPITDRIWVGDDFSCYYNCFMLTSNGKDLETAKKLLEQYDDNNVPDNLREWYDKKILEKANVVPNELKADVIHFSGFDVNPHYMGFANTFEEYNDIYTKYLLKKENVLKIFRTEKGDLPKNENVQFKNLYKIRDEDDRNAIIECVRNAALFLG